MSAYLCSSETLLFNYTQVWKLTILPVVILIEGICVFLVCILININFILLHAAMSICVTCGTLLIVVSRAMAIPNSRFDSAIGESTTVTFILPKSEGNFVRLVFVSCCCSSVWSLLVVNVTQLIFVKLQEQCILQRHTNQCFSFSDGNEENINECPSVLTYYINT